MELDKETLRKRVEVREGLKELDRSITGLKRTNLERKVSGIEEEVDEQKENIQGLKDRYQAVLDNAIEAKENGKEAVDGAREMYEERIPGQSSNFGLFLDSLEEEAENDGFKSEGRSKEGNSLYKDALRRFARVSETGIDIFDNKTPLEDKTIDSEEAKEKFLKQFESYAGKMKKEVCENLEESIKELKTIKEIAKQGDLEEAFDSYKTFYENDVERIGDANSSTAEMHDKFEKEKENVEAVKEQIEKDGKDLRERIEGIYSNKDFTTAEFTFKALKDKYENMSNLEPLMAEQMPDTDYNTEIAEYLKNYLTRKGATDEMEDAVPTGRISGLTEKVPSGITNAGKELLEKVKGKARNIPIEAKKLRNKPDTVDSCAEYGEENEKDYQPSTEDIVYAAAVTGSISDAKEVMDSIEEGDAEKLSEAAGEYLKLEGAGWEWNEDVAEEVIDRLEKLDYQRIFDLETAYKQGGNPQYQNRKGMKDEIAMREADWRESEA